MNFGIPATFLERSGSASAVLLLFNRWWPLW